MTKMKIYQKLVITLSLGLSLIGCGGVGSDATETKDLPVAVNDTKTVTENSAAINILVLDNDTTTGELDVSSVEIITDPQHGKYKVTDTGEVEYKPNINYHGTDSLKYTVRDKKGNFSNPATVTITITQAPDNTAPVITITGANPITIEVGTTYVDEGATATDNRDPSVTVATSGTVNTNVLGENTLTYSATDSAGNPAIEKKRKVTVQDTTPPIITINAINPTIIERTDTKHPFINNPLDASIVTVSDNLDTIIFANITPPLGFDINIVGDYPFTYAATDSSGNKAVEKTLTIKVIHQTLTLIGADHIHKNCEGIVDKSGLDTNDNGLLEDSEVITLTNAIYTKGTPITREQLRDRIANNKDVTSVNTCEITSMVSLFLNLGGANVTTFNQDISGWNVGSVTNMGAMFRGVTDFNRDIGSWDVRSVTNMQQMFFEASSFADGNIDAWGDKVANVSDMSWMFFQATSFNGTIDNWDVSSVTDMGQMFWNASNFTGGDLSLWDVSSVTDMSSMFRGTKLVDGNVGAWGDKVKNVEEMDHMFSRTPFNGDLGSWDVSSVTTMLDMFRGASDFVDGNIGAWGDKVKNVKDMGLMFNRASAFHGDISDWNVSSVTDMTTMFEQATAFNGYIGKWDVSSVTRMENMFNQATAFTNHDLSNWEVSNVINHTDFMTGAGAGNTEPNW